MMCFNKTVLSERGLCCEGKICVYSGDSIVACTDKNKLCSIEEDVVEGSGVRARIILNLASS